MKYIFIFCFLFVIQSCELFPKAPDCHIPEELNKQNLTKSEYNDIVYSYLQKSKPDDYRYFFRTFVERESSTVMSVNFRNENTCFDVEVLVQDWSMLEGMRKVNGKSYPKELRNLKWELSENRLVKYIEMDRIID